MSFLYYFPNRDTPLSKNNFTEADRKEGLDVVLRDAPLAYLMPCKGPDDGNGCLVMIARADFPETNCQHLPERQEWRKVSDHYWIGWYKDDKPTPERLQRPKMIEGEEVEIDGQTWIVPVCGPSINRLPFAWRKVAGKMQTVVKGQYRYLMDASEQLLADFDKKATDEEAIERQVKFCITMLSVNYRVGEEEASELELVGDESFSKIILAALGRLTYDREAERKKADAATAISG